METKTEYEQEVRKFVDSFGGFFNAHAHGDRAFTGRDEYYSNADVSVSEIERLSLKEKQSLVWQLHRGKAFEESCIRERLERLLDSSISFGVKRLNSCIDVTYNTGLNSWNVAKELSEKYKDKIDFNLGVYNVSGFKNTKPERFNVFEEAAGQADFIVALAEKDAKEGHIGEKQHNVYVLNLGLELNKPVHFHVGQANTSEDRGAELLFECMDWVYDVQHRLEDFPENMLVHDISASCYDKDDFEKHCENIKRLNLGVICCPSAGISMKQARNFQVPTHNSLTRLWDYAVREIPISLGTDNINDVFVPSSSPDMYDEVAYLSNILRFYDPRILAKVASGVDLDDFDRGKIKRVLNNFPQ